MLFIYFSLGKFAKLLMSYIKALVSFPSNFALAFSAIKHNFSVLFFSSNIIYFGQRNQLKSEFFRFPSVRVKICQIPLVNFQVTSQFLFKFCIILHCHGYHSSVNFNLMHFLPWAKGSHQSPNFDTFKSSGENLPNFCHFSNHQSVFLQIFHNSSVSWKIIPLYCFSSKERIIHFSGNLSTGTDLAININLVKCITKNKYI